MPEYALKEGMQAPEFTLPTLDGDLSLADYRDEKNVVLYFYPRDNTAGCTKEAVAFRDAAEELATLDTVVVGVSKDTLKSHGRFRDKHELNFPLVSDEERVIIEGYDVWKEKKLYGKVSMGVVRSTFLIDKAGVVRKAWHKVKVAGHVEQVLEAVREL